MIFNGNQLNIMVDGVNIANAITVNLDTVRNNIAVTRSRTNGNRERIPGIVDGSLTYGGYYDVDTTRYEPGTFISWIFRGSGGSFLGNGYITTTGYNGDTDNATKTNGSIETTGQIQFVRQQSDTLCVNDVALCVDGHNLTALI